MRPAAKRKEPTSFHPSAPCFLPLRSPPAAPRRRRGWRRRRRRRHSPVMRRRGRRRRHPPMVAVVMMVVVCDHAAIHVSSGERSSGECDCSEGRDEFDLVHGMVPFFAWCLCVSLDGSPDQSADEPAKERCADLAPVLRVERGAVMAVVVTVIVVMLRLMVPCMGRRRRCVTRHLVPGCRTHWRGMSHRGCPYQDLRSLRSMLGRSRCLCHVCIRRGSLCRCRLLCRCLHRRRSLALRRRVPFRSGHRRATESAAHRERHNHLLYCLVHCRVPFVIRASPFSRLQKDRTIRREFLTKDFEAVMLGAARDHETRRI